MNIQSELNTINSTLTDCSRRLTAVVDKHHETLPSDVYAELVAAERAIGALQRRLHHAVRRIT